MDLKWFGVAGISIREGESSVLIDPFINRNPKLYQPSLEKFASYDSILVTHGHFDHIEDIPKIYELNPKVKIYCTACVKKTLIKLGVSQEAIVKIEPEDKLSVNGFEIDVYKSAHVKFDLRQIIHNACQLNTYTQFPTLVKSGLKCLKYVEGHEIVSFHIKSEIDDVFIIGSLALDKNTVYPKNVSNLVLAFQGNTKIGKTAPKIIEIFNPKTVILDHFDDGFPPITSNIDTDPLINKMGIINPDLSVFRPIAGMRYHLGKVESINTERCNFAVWDNSLYSKT